MSSDSQSPKQPPPDLRTVMSQFIAGEDVGDAERRIRLDFKTELEQRSLLTSVEDELGYEPPERSQTRLVRSFERLNVRMALQENVTASKGDDGQKATLHTATSRPNDGGWQFFRTWYWPVVTVMGMVALIGIGIGVSVHQKNSQTTSRVYTTAKGQRANVMLPDGTHVVLGVASTLRYVEDATTHTRDIDLNGEAYFEVMHDPKYPFVVHTNGAMTRVLGTSFSVRGYHSDSATRVVVATGRVSLNQTILNAGDLGRAAAENVVVTRGVPVESAFAWTTGTIVFDNTPLSDVLTELGRWYDASFSIGDPALLSRRVSGKFTRSTVTDIADIIATATGSRYEQSGKHITFRTGGKRAF